MKRNLIARIIYLYYVLLLKTVRLRVVGHEEPTRETADGKTPVFASAHNSLLTSVMAWDGKNATLLASLSQDGQIITKLLEKRGFKMARGSSSRGGAKGLSSLLDALALKIPVGITFDGPRGPALVPKRGVSACAKHASGSVYFVYGIPKPTLGYFKLWLRLRSWDRFLLPLPFCTIDVVFENISEGLPDKNSQSWEGVFLEKLQKKAFDVYGELYADGLGSK